MEVGIIGGGPSGLFCAYELSKCPNISITIFEQGKNLDKRLCPVLSGKTSACLHCDNCSIMNGVAGAGAFSDGKYNITDEFGGWLKDIIGSKKLIEYENKSNDILEYYGATKEFFEPDDSLKKLCLQNGLIMQQSKCKHLGTDANYQVMLNMVSDLSSNKNVLIKSDTKVIDCVYVKDSCKWRVSALEKGHIEQKDYDKVIFAVGRSGSSFFYDWCKQHAVQLSNRQVDIGVRVELPSEIWEDFEKKIYEPKILYKTKQYGDTVRMFCFNGRGEVVNENTDGIVTVNGHAYKAENKKTKNTNFALLSSINFTEPFNEPIKYAKYVAGLANMISGGSVIVQTLGDLRRGRRTDDSRLERCSTVPSLKAAVPGDLSLCMPKRQLDNIIEMLNKLDEIAPGTANDDTLLYGIECKYYSAMPECTKNFELIMDCGLMTDVLTGVYAIGDGAGFTRSLAQAAAHGLLLADNILSEVNIH